MAKRDYYDILGVSKSADNKEIKKAYRKIAIKFHPDKNPGDIQAEEKFKEATEAYEILTDQEKREAYDRFGHAGVDPNQGGGFGGQGNFGDIFGDVFGDIFGGGRGGRSVGERYRIEVDEGTPLCHPDNEGVSQVLFDIIRLYEASEIIVNNSRTSTPLGGRNWAGHEKNDGGEPL